MIHDKILKSLKHDKLLLRNASAKTKIGISSVIEIYIISFEYHSLLDSYQAGYFVTFIDITFQCHLLQMSSPPVAVF